MANSVFNLLETLGVNKEEITPEWNINYYNTLLKYTKKTVKRNKILQELEWWTLQKKFKDQLKK